MVKRRGRNLSWHPPFLTTTPTGEDVSALNKFKVHRFPIRRVFSGTWLELVTCQPLSDTLITRLPRPRDGPRSIEPRPSTKKDTY
ncbi:hypothetical protein TNCV_2377451 [Trichonephila clavipes]|nr:hypothetical protein TNCV_2377451 [Trichonephila clavipes]